MFNRFLSKSGGSGNCYNYQDCNVMLLEDHGEETVHIADHENFGSVSPYSVTTFSV